jgi:hypothetical protein
MLKYSTLVIYLICYQLVLSIFISLRLCHFLGPAEQKRKEEGTRGWYSQKGPRCNKGSD